MRVSGSVDKQVGRESFSCQIVTPTKGNGRMIKALGLVASFPRQSAISASGKTMYITDKAKSSGKTDQPMLARSPQVKRTAMVCISGQIRLLMRVVGSITR
jgi:hypothetical protein